MKISKIILHTDHPLPEIQISKLSDFLERTFHRAVELDKEFFKNLDERFFYDMASSRIFNLDKPFESHSPTKEEIEFERKSFDGVIESANIVLYDGFEVKTILQEKIISTGDVDENFHVFLTQKLMCTYDFSDYRYHGRALIASNPSIISVTGIIEAPAKPRNYYIDLMSQTIQGLNVDSIKEKYSGTYLEKNDERLPIVIQGYLLQAIFYYFTGEAFCESKNCRLFNAHWQKDLIFSQLEIGKLCEKHQEILQSLDINLNS